MPTINDFYTFLENVSQRQLYFDAILVAALWLFGLWSIFACISIRRVKICQGALYEGERSRIWLYSMLLALGGTVLSGIMDMLAGVAHEQHMLSFFIFPLVAFFVTFIIEKWKLKIGAAAEISNEIDPDVCNDEILRKQFIEFGRLVELGDADLASPRFRAKCKLAIDTLNFKTMEQQKQLDNIEVNINGIRESLLEDKKSELLALIYLALGNGYTTTELDIEIKSKKKGYKALGGNGELEDLLQKYQILEFRSGGA